MGSKINGLVKFHRTLSFIDMSDLSFNAVEQGLNWRRWVTCNVTKHKVSVLGMQGNSVR